MYTCLYNRIFPAVSINFISVKPRFYMKEQFNLGFRNQNDKFWQNMLIICTFLEDEQEKIDLELPKFEKVGSKKTFLSIFKISIF